MKNKNAFTRYMEERARLVLALRHCEIPKDRNALEQARVALDRNYARSVTLTREQLCQ